MTFRTTLLKEVPRSILTGLFVLLCGLPLVSRAGETSISNNVTVSADGGSAHASVETTINGKTVVNVEQNGSGSLSSETAVHADGSVATSSTSTVALVSSTSTNTTAYAAIEKQLLALIRLLQYYVSLLQNA